jgi:hypothetical protein
MTDDPAAKAGTEGETRPLGKSGTPLEDLLQRFLFMSMRLELGEDVAGTEVVRAGMSLGTVRKTILDEVRRHEARVLNTAGSDRTDALDLDDIRTRIGRRLDRIRAVRGAG